MFCNLAIYHRVELKIINIMLFNCNRIIPHPRETKKCMKSMYFKWNLVTTMLLSINNAAEALSISRSSVYRLISEGRIPAVIIVGKMRIKQSSLKSYVDQLERENRTNQVRR